MVTMAGRISAGPSVRTVLPTTLMGVVAQISGLADGSLGSKTLFEISTALLVLANLAIYTLGRRTWPWVPKITPLVYLASATTLILSQKSTSSGLSIILLTPVLAVAIRGSWHQAAVTVVAMLACLATISIAHHSHAIVIARALLLWAGMGTMVTVVIHQFRARLEHVQSQLERQATTDPLTGLANRRGFADAVVARRGRRPFALLAIDVDGLKEVNDTGGHDAGDELIRTVAHACAGVARAGDVVARLGGDEFAVFLANADATDAAAAAERMRDAIRHCTVRGRPVQVSIGVAAGGPASEFDAVLAEADAAMYKNKRQNRRPGSMTGLPL